MPAPTADRRTDPDKRARLIESAVRLFGSEGIDETTTNRIAREAGVAAGTLFNYFESKDDLIDAAYLSCKKDLAAHLRHAVSGQGTLRDQLEKAWCVALEWSLKNGEKHDFMAHFSHSPRASRESLKRELHSEFQFLHDSLQSAAGQINEVPADFFEVVVQASLQAGVQYLRNQPRRKQAAAMAASFGFFWRGLAGKD